MVDVKGSIDVSKDITEEGYQVQRLITEDTTYTIKNTGGDFASFTDALEFLKDYRIKEGVTVTLQMDLDIYNLTELCVCEHEDSDKIEFKGTISSTAGIQSSSIIPPYSIAATESCLGIDGQTFTVVGHSFVVGDILRIEADFDIESGTLFGIVEPTSGFFVTYVSGNDFKLNSFLSDNVASFVFDGTGAITFYKWKTSMIIDHNEGFTLPDITGYGITITGGTPDKYCCAKVLDTTSYVGSPVWSYLTTYGLDDIVESSPNSNVYYKSLQVGNLNNNPYTEPTWWVRIYNNIEIEVGYGFPVLTGGGFYYMTTVRSGELAAFTATSKPVKLLKDIAFIGVPDDPYTPVFGIFAGTSLSSGTSGGGSVSVEGLAMIDFTAAFAVTGNSAIYKTNNSSSTTMINNCGGIGVGLASDAKLMLGGVYARGCYYVAAYGGGMFNFSESNLSGCGYGFLFFGGSADCSGTSIQACTAGIICGNGAVVLADGIAIGTGTIFGGGCFGNANLSVQDGSIDGCTQGIFCGNGSYISISGTTITDCDQDTSGPINVVCNGGSLIDDGNTPDFNPEYINSEMFPSSPVTFSMLTDTIITDITGGSTENFPLFTGSGKKWTLVNANASAITYNCQGSDELSGLTSLTINQYESYVIQDVIEEGAIILAKYIP
jgi:hypothetical protein